MGSALWSGREEGEKGVEMYLRCLDPCFVKYLKGVRGVLVN